MKRKINQMLVLIATLAIFLTVILFTVVYYDLFRKQVMEALQITLSDKDGAVVFDSEAAPQQMEISQSTFYYELQLENGEVLRVAKDAGSIFSIFGKILPSLLMVLGVLFIICLWMARFLTLKLIHPIEQLAENMDEYPEQADYEELLPFIHMIKQHHQEVMKNARMRQEFSANVSHELKTPLTAITGYAELIETGMASEKDVVRFAQGIHSSAKRLLTLINDIIRLSELDGTEQEFSMESVNLFELAKTCVEMMTLSAEKHNVTIALQGQSCYVRGNQQMLEELLYNLCDNAIRYNNPHGEVLVQVYPIGKGSCLEVQDTGIGISEEHQERIFERFYRVDKSRSKSTGGTGLGLAIVKHIITRHDAHLELDSEVGKGTTIKVIFTR